MTDTTLAPAQAVGPFLSSRGRTATLTAFWAVLLVLVLRSWTLTYRAPGLLVWTLLALAAFLLTALALRGPKAWADRARVRGPATGWLGIVAGVLLLHTLVPQLLIQGQTVRTVSAVSIIDLVLPFWIAARALVLVWGRRAWLGFAVALPLTLFSGYAAMIPMPGAPYAGALPPLTGSQLALQERLRSHVQRLAVDIGERNAEHYDALERTAAYLDAELHAAGFQVASQSFEAGGRRFRNLHVTIPGDAARDEIIVVGAHYDSAPGSPGADDNASATAALIELARMLRTDRPSRTIRLVAFTNEEPPFFQTAAMGSRVHARTARRERDDIVAMLSLETIGYYSDAQNSQRYPFPLNLFYPDRGDFIAFVGDLASRRLVRRSVDIFRETTPFPAHGIASPAFVPGVNWSDHASFWLYGYPALMITDTAPFRSHDYHTLDDTPAKLDYGRMARVVEGVATLVRRLANPA